MPTRCDAGPETTAPLERAIIIRRRQVDLSMRYAETCARSCRRLGVPFEFLDAVEYVTCREAFEVAGVPVARDYRNSPGNCCCHASHILAWRRIVETGVVTLVMEHDAVLKGDPRGLSLPLWGMTTLGFRVSVPDAYDPPGPPEAYVPIPRTAGPHAYVVSPQTARWMLEKQETEGVHMGVDKWLAGGHSGVPVFAMDPPQAICWPRLTTTHHNVEGSIQKLGGSRRGKTTNFPESLPAGWHRGLRG